MHVPAAVQERIASWRLPVEVEDELYERLDKELGGHPDEYIRGVVAPVRFEQYSFSTKTDAARFTFIFRVNRQNDGSILIEDCYRLPFAIDFLPTPPLTVIPHAQSTPDGTDEPTEDVE